MTDPKRQSGEPLWLVYSREHNAWWRPNAAGYTVHVEQAGRYSRHDAEAHCDTRNTCPHGGPSEFPVFAPEAIQSLQERCEDQQKLGRETADLAAKFHEELEAERAKFAALQERCGELEKQNELFLSVGAGDALKPYREAQKRIAALEGALRDIRSKLNDEIHGQINYRPEDWIWTVDQALAPGGDGGEAE